MIKMFKKAISYLKSGGPDEVFGYMLIYLRKLIYYRSETVFLYLDKIDYIQTYKASDIVYKIVQDSTVLQKIDFDRIKTVKFKEWFDKESKVIIGFKLSQPISFTWTHIHSYTIHGVCKIKLSDNKCWIGPTFVSNYLRGKGINKAQIKYQISNTPKHIQYFLTSANAKNIASIKTFENLGFKVGLKMTKYYGVFVNKKSKMNYVNNGNLIFDFL